MGEWYRRTTWSKEDEEDFFMKLARARAWGRPQYLRIQAVHLVGEEEPELLDVAEMLIQKLLNDYPENLSEMSSALGLLGDIYKLKKEFDRALEYYRMAVEFEKKFPNESTDAYLEYAVLVVKLKKYELFEFAGKIVEMRIQKSIFPIEKYKGFSVLSIIYGYKGDKEKADQFATLAEKNASAETSDLRYHRYLGIVKNRDDQLDSLVGDYT